jgi:hypothetical protein
MTPDAPIAASSPAPTAAPDPITAADKAVATSDVAAYRAAKLQERTGTPPIADHSAASAAATPVDPAASTDATTTAAASEPAKGKGAKARSAELDAEIVQLRDRLKLRAELRAELDRREPPKLQDAPAVSSAAKAPEKFPDYAAYLDQHPDAPLEQWLDARDEWRDTQRDSKARAQSEAAQRTTAQTARTEKVRSQIATKVAADPEFLARVKPEILDLKPFDALAPGEAGGPLNAIAEEILDSPVMPDLLVHFSEHPEDLDRLAQLRDPRALVREFGKLEARFDTTPATATSAAPRPKTITDAPAPPTTLGSRPSEAIDPVTAAVVSGDQSAFKAAKHQQRLAAVRR